MSGAANGAGSPAEAHVGAGPVSVSSLVCKKRKAEGELEAFEASPGAEEARAPTGAAVAPAAEEKAAAPTGGFAAFAAAQGRPAGFAGFASFATSAPGGGFGGFAKSAGAAGAEGAPASAFGAKQSAGFGSGGGGASAAAASDDEAAGEPDAHSPPPAPEYRPLVSLPEAPRLTGEEQETTLFAGPATLYSFEAAEPGKPPTWRERGRGEVRCNVARAGGGGGGGGGGAARLVMRAAGNLRLILNAKLFKGMLISPLDGGKGVTFPCVNAADDGPASEGTEAASGAAAALRTFAVRLRGGDAQERAKLFQGQLEKAVCGLGEPAASEGAGEDADAAREGLEAV